AIMVGPQGKTIGIDFVPEMVQRAKQNLQLAQLQNVSFELGSAENLPFASEGFDCVISNGAYNLIPDKSKALQEALRVLKRAGKFMIADQVLSEEFPSGPMERVETWAK
ncbi:MAG: methyltransferase domain-containing protein, partial [Syntrophobacteraceae bacterium]